jgi:hypothetical protein
MTRTPRWSFLLLRERWYAALRPEPPWSEPHRWIVLGLLLVLLGLWSILR